MLGLVFFHKSNRNLDKRDLGSTRLLTNLSQCVVDDLDYFPFGKLNPYSPPCPWEDTTHKFTGKERDSESNLDNFTARYYSSAQGRFMSPDPTGGHLVNPQSLNKYAYALNNPVSLTDPTGLDSYLQCSPALDVDGNSVPSDTCQQKAVGYDSNGNADRQSKCRWHWAFGG
jgi:RHS repeat-associated protein